MAMVVDRNEAERGSGEGPRSESPLIAGKPRRIGGAPDITRFYYKKSSTVSKRSSLSLDSVLVGLLLARFGSDQKLRRWVGAQAKMAQENGFESSKSVSRAVQENAIRIIADPALIAMLGEAEAAEAERQAIMVPWLGQTKQKPGRPSSGRRL